MVPPRRQYADVSMLVRSSDSLKVFGAALKTCMRLFFGCICLVDYSEVGNCYDNKYSALRSFFLSFSFFLFSFFSFQDIETKCKGGEEGQAGGGR